MLTRLAPIGLALVLLALPSEARCGDDSAVVEDPAPDDDVVRDAIVPMLDGFDAFVAPLKARADEIGLEAISKFDEATWTAIRAWDLRAASAKRLSLAPDARAIVDGDPELGAALAGRDEFVIRLDALLSAHVLATIRTMASISADADGDAAAEYQHRMTALLKLIIDAEQANQRVRDALP